MLGRFSFLQDKKKLFIFLLLIIGLPLATWLALQQQDVRQRASESGNNPSVPTVQFLYDKPTAPVVIGQNVPLTLYIDAGTTKVTALDFTFAFDKTLADFVSFTPQISLEQLINTSSAANTMGTFRYAVSSPSTTGITGKTAIGSILFTAKAAGTFSPTIIDVQVIGEGYTGVALNTLIERPSIAFVTTPTATPIPPTSTPIPPTATPIPTATPVPPTATPMPLDGDINGDRSLDILDYNIWRNEFVKLSTTKQSDLNKDGKIDLLDFSIWRDAFIKAVTATPTTAAPRFINLNQTTGNIGDRIRVDYNGFTLPSGTPAIYFNNTIANADFTGSYALATVPPGATTGKVKMVLGDGTTVFSVGDFTVNQVATPKRVFQTSTTYTGNLGGLSGADAKCQDRANAANLGGTWKAWLSDNSNSPSTRFIKSTAAYKKINGITIANDWNDLIDGTILSGINMNEFGAPMTSGLSAWTGTTANGTFESRNLSCNGWTSSATTFEGLTGNNSTTNGNWSNSSGTIRCDGPVNLYCFEQ